MNMTMFPHESMSLLSIASSSVRAAAAAHRAPTSWPIVQPMLPSSVLQAGTSALSAGVKAAAAEAPDAERLITSLVQGATDMSSHVSERQRGGS